jgi:serine/threonine protein kinase
MKYVNLFINLDYHILKKEENIDILNNFKLLLSELYPENLKSLLGQHWFENIVEYADYYDINNMPYITYFNSFEELPFILNSLDFNKISDKMKDFIRILLVPNPEKRPSIAQVLQIVDGWSQLSHLKLSDEAQEIKDKQTQGGKH